MLGEGCGESLAWWAFFGYHDAQSTTLCCTFGLEILWERREGTMRHGKSSARRCDGSPSSTTLRARTTPPTTSSSGRNETSGKDQYRTVAPSRIIFGARRS